MSEIETVKTDYTWFSVLRGCLFFLMLGVIGVVGFIAGLKYLWLATLFIWERV
jgi:hypothetical protein